MAVTPGSKTALLLPNPHKQGRAARSELSAFSAIPEPVIEPVPTPAQPPLSVFLASDREMFAGDNASRIFTRNSYSYLIEAWDLSTFTYVTLPAPAIPDSTPGVQQLTLVGDRLYAVWSTASGNALFSYPAAEDAGTWTQVLDLSSAFEIQGFTKLASGETVLYTLTPQDEWTGYVAYYHRLDGTLGCKFRICGLPATPTYGFGDCNGIFARGDRYPSDLVQCFSPAENVWSNWAARRMNNGTVYAYLPDGGVCCKESATGDIIRVPIPVTTSTGTTLGLFLSFGEDCAYFMAFGVDGALCRYTFSTRVCETLYTFSGRAVRTATDMGHGAILVSTADGSSYRVRVDALQPDGQLVNIVPDFPPASCYADAAPVYYRDGWVYNVSASSGITVFRGKVAIAANGVVTVVTNPTSLVSYTDSNYYANPVAITSDGGAYIGNLGASSYRVCHVDAAGSVTFNPTYATRPYFVSTGGWMFVDEDDNLWMTCSAFLPDAVTGRYAYTTKAYRVTVPDLSPQTGTTRVLGTFTSNQQCPHFVCEDTGSDYVLKEFDHDTTICTFPKTRAKWEVIMDATGTLRTAVVDRPFRNYPMQALLMGDPYLIGTDVVYKVTDHGAVVTTLPASGGDRGYARVTVDASCLRFGASWLYLVNSRDLDMFDVAAGMDVAYGVTPVWPDGVGYDTTAGKGVVIPITSHLYFRDGSEVPEPEPDTRRYSQLIFQTTDGKVLIEYNRYAGGHE